MFDLALPDGVELVRTTPTFDDRPELIRLVEVDEVQVIPPGRLHHLVIEGPVTLAVEFHR